MSIKNGIVLCIFALALFLRIYLIDRVPPSASLDEVSLGYNAYSIAKTGADEYGMKFPLLLRAYDDWRPALYTYFIIPFLPIFGLSATAVRLPSVVLGIVTIVFTYLIAMELLHKSDKGQHWTKWIPLVTAFFLAISPWHIYISRLGHEVNLGIVLVVAATFFFLRWTRIREVIFLLSSFLLFSLSLYGYQSEKIVAPLWVGALLFAYWRAVLKAKRIVVLSALCAFVVALPAIVLSVSPEGLTRLRGTSVFTHHPMYDFYEKDLIQARASGDIVGKIMSHPLTTSVRIFMDNYGKHLQTKWLFTGKLIESHKVPYTGLFYWWDSIFPMIAIFWLIKKNLKKEIALVLFFILSSILPSALTTQAPQAMRSFTALPFWIILSAAGICYLTSSISKNMKILAFLVIGIIGLSSVMRMYTNYLEVFPLSQSDTFQYALTDAIQYVVDHAEGYDRIIVSNSGQLYQSYMFYLFHSSFNPKTYQLLGGTGSGGYDKTHTIGNIEFRPVAWEQDKKLKRALIVGNPSDFPGNETGIHQSLFLNGSVGAIAVAL